MLSYVHQKGSNGSITASGKQNDFGCCFEVPPYRETAMDVTKDIIFLNLDTTLSRSAPVSTSASLLWTALRTWHDEQTESWAGDIRNTQAVRQHRKRICTRMRVGSDGMINSWNISARSRRKRFKSPSNWHGGNDARCQHMKPVFFGCVSTHHEAQSDVS